MTLEIIDLSVQKARQNIVGPLNFFLPKNHTLGIMGPSGSGKTTLAKSILALSAPLEMRGEIRFDGVVIHRNNTTVIPPKNRRFGYLPQQCSLWPHLNVEESLMLAERLSAPRQKNLETSALLKLFGLNELLKSRPHELSGGQKQRLALACALAAKPQLLIFDEPLSALDIVAKMELILLIKSLQHNCGFTAIFITHDIAEAMAVCDYILILDKGQKLWHGPKDALKKAPFSPTWNPLASPLLLPFS